MIRNLLWYTPAENYQNRAWFDKVNAKIKYAIFFDSHEKYVSTGLFFISLNYYRIIFANANVSRIVSIILKNDNILVGKFYSEAWSGFTIPRSAPPHPSRLRQPTTGGACWTSLSELAPKRASAPLISILGGGADHVPGALTSSAFFGFDLREVLRLHREARV